MAQYRDRVTQLTPLEHSSQLSLHKTVFLGYTDVAAGGIRALLGINMKKEYYDLVIPELSGCAVACVSKDPLDPRDQSLRPIQVFNLKYEQFSVILVNTLLPPEKCHYVCSQVMDLCTQCCVQRLVVLSALRVEMPTAELCDIYENTIYNTPLTKYPSLPENARINDAFLSTLVQMIQVEYVPSSFFIIPAHRACLGPARVEDGSELVITTFQKVIDEVMKISFDSEFSLNLLYKGENKTDNSSVSMMYS